MSDSNTFFQATSILLHFLPQIYKEDTEIIIPYGLYDGLTQLYPNKNEEDYLIIKEDLKSKYKTNGNIKVDNIKML